MLIRRTRTLLAVGLIAAVAGLAARPAAAGTEEEVFTVRGVPVDVTAETAAAAREQAHAEGHVKAMEILLARLLPREDVARVRPLKPAEVVEYVKDFEVAHERTSDVRYLANMTFRFKPAAVRELLRANGLPFAETLSKPVLVLPIYGTAGRAQLWEESNPWRRTWADRRPGDWLVPLVVPLGDLGDIAALDVDQALSGDSERLAGLAQRYGADDILITQAVLSGDLDAGTATLQVGTSRLGKQQHQTVVESFAQQPGEALDAMLARAADAVEAEVQEAWKQRNLLLPGERQRITVTVPVTSLADWLEIERRLGTVASVERSEVSLISRSKTEVDITFVGSEAQLALAAAQSDLSLTFDDTLGWQLQRAGAGPAPAVAPAPQAVAPASQAVSPEPPAGPALEASPAPGPATPGQSAPADE